MNPLFVGSGDQWLSNLNLDWSTRILSYVVVIFLSFWLGGLREKGRDLNEHIKKLEEVIWDFARQSNLYWTTIGRDQKSRELEAVIRQLSTRIGSEIADLESKHRNFRFRPPTPLTELRRAATAPPFEASERDADSDRANLVLERAEDLIAGIRASRRSIFSVFSDFRSRHRLPDS